MRKPRQMKLRWLLVVPIMAFCTPLLAQEKEVVGMVTSAENGEPLAGVNVFLSGTKEGIATDDAGRYSLTVPSSSTSLSFEFIGYQSQTIAVGDQTTINVSLVSESTDLGEVVVTALGIERQAKSLTYSAQVIGGDDMNEAKETNLINSLQGKVAGVNISKSATGPGGSSRVVLRGNRSITGGNQPLYIVDGVPMNSGSRAAGSGSFGGRDGGGGISMLNPDNIESMTVLKGASAAALYGSAGQNGAIVITTKSGKDGKLSVEYNGGMTFDEAISLPEYQDKYGQGSGGEFLPGSEYSWGAKLDGQPVTLWNGNTVPYVAHPDNVKNFLRVASTVNNSVTISGGNEKMRTLFSYGNVAAQGVLRNNEMVRHNVDLKVDNNITDKLSVTAKVTYIYQDIDNMPQTGEAGRALSSMFRAPVSIPLDQMKEFNYYDEAGIERQNYWNPGSSIRGNPYWLINRELFFEKKNRVMGLVQANYAFTDWLDLLVRASIDKTMETTDNRIYNDNYLFAGLGSNYILGDYTRQSTNVDALLTMQRDLSERFNLTAFVGASLQQGQAYTVTVDANGLNKINFFDMINARSPLTDDAFTQSPQVQSLYGSATLGYNDYLFLDVTARNDWSSALPEGSWSYFYPSIGLTGVISEMTTLPSWINYGKVRVSMAYSGSGGAAYRDRNYYTVGRGGTIGTQTTRALPTYKPEITRAFEAGLEWRFFDNRLGLDVTYYTTDTENQLITLAMPAASLFSSQYINAGLINNSGVEAMVNVTPVRLADFTWDATFNFAKNVNKVVRLTDELKRVILVDDRQVLEVAEEGGSYGDMYGIGWQRDEQGRPLVSDTGNPLLTGGKTVYMGNYNPNYTLGFNNTFTYKNISLSFLLDYRNGGTVIAGTQAMLDFDGHSKASLWGREDGIVLDAYTVDGQKNTQAIASQDYFAAVGEREPASEFYAYSGTNLRLREVIVGYSFSPSILGENGFIRSARISLVGRNLFFFSKDAPFDPEVVTGTGNYQGIEYNSLPSTRNIGLNLKLMF